MYFHITSHIPLKVTSRVSPSTASVQSSQGGSQCSVTAGVVSLLLFSAVPRLTAYDSGFEVGTEVARKYSSTFAALLRFLCREGAREAV